MTAPSSPPAPRSPDFPRRSIRRTAVRIALHLAFLLVAVACLAAYEHLRIEGHTRAALVSLIAAAAFGFAPLRELIRMIFHVEGKTLHLVHVLGGLGLVALPLTGVVSGTPVL
ncbi:MAG: hypothetical protein ACRENQ_07675, partial [Gemmatimonadaceae bacterium]